MKPSPTYSPLRPRSEAARALADAEATRVGHVIRWHKPREVHGFIIQSGRCSKCRARPLVVSHPGKVTVEGLMPCVPK